MKRLVCIMALSLLLWPGCSTQQDRASQSENNGTEAARQEKQVYQQQVEARLRELDEEIDALKIKMRAQKEVDRKQLEQPMAELDRKRAACHRDLEKLKNSSEDAWRDLKVGIDAAMDDLEAAYEQAASHFR